MSLTKSNQILSELTIYLKYARFLENEKRRENWHEIVNRNFKMHQEKFPELAEEISEVYKNFVLPKKILPSMRSIQFAGPAIKQNETRMYNCAYLPIVDLQCFSEAFYLLLGGTGVGFSVQERHIDKLGSIYHPKQELRVFRIEDSVIGWADAVKILMTSFFTPDSSKIEFDYSLIRKQGELLKTSGGKAPGPEPLKNMLNKIEAIFYTIQEGDKLNSLICSDIMCLLADAVLAGGIRRAAMICLFDADDQAMLKAKEGQWFVKHPYRARANYSAVLLRSNLIAEGIDHVLDHQNKNQSGEPGIYLTNDLDWGTNPCCEIALKPFQFCNLSEINLSDVKDQKDFNERARAASFLGTLQASYTDFKYLRPLWKTRSEEEALLGVSLTGIASVINKNLNFQEAATHVKIENYRLANLIGINPAKRCTTVKPAGTTSLVFGSSSGIHAWHSPYYLRRIRISKDDALACYLVKEQPSFVEYDEFDPNSIVFSVPQKAPEHSVFREEGVSSLLNRVGFIFENWVKIGHRQGVNYHNISCTVSYRPKEFLSLKKWMWENRNSYNGLALFPFDGGTYVQAPFQEISKKQFEAMNAKLKLIDLNHISLEFDSRNLIDQVACSGGACEI